MLLGIPYMGSKRRLAPKIIDYILKNNPNCKYIYDLFGGGGAVTFEALQRPQIKKVFYNELNSGVVNLLKKIRDEGVTNEFYNWIDRETFSKLKNGDDWKAGLVKTCWSFGNNQRGYIFGKNIEEYKKQAHNFVVYDCSIGRDYLKKHFRDSYYWHFDYMPLENRRLIFVDLVSKIEAIRVTRLYGDSVYNEYKDFNLDSFMSLSQKDICRCIDRYFPEIPKKKGKRSTGRLKDLQHLEHLEHLQHLEQLQRLEQLEQLQRLEHLEHLEHLQRLEQLQHLQQLERLIISNLSYEKVQINTPIEETILYLDPPYENTEVYQDTICHRQLEEYISKSPYKIYISSYEFELPVVAEWSQRSLMSATNKSKNVMEKLFCNREEKTRDVQKDLFNFVA